MESAGVQMPKNVTYNYSHRIGIIRSYSDLIYVSGIREWVRKSRFRTKYTEKFEGRRATVIKVLLDDIEAGIVVWDEDKNVMLQEGWMYEISYLTPLKSAAPIFSERTYETTFNTDIKRLEDKLTTVSFVPRKCVSIEYLQECTQVKSPFNELDIVGRIESVNESSAKLTDCKGHNITIHFPNGIKDEGVQNIIADGSVVAILNLYVNACPLSNQCMYEFGLRTIVTNEPGQSAEHLIANFELCKLEEINLDNLSTFSVSTASSSKQMSSGNQQMSGINVPSSPVDTYETPQFTSFFTSISKNEDVSNAQTLSHSVTQEFSPSVIPCSDETLDNNSLCEQNNVSLHEIHVAKKIKMNESPVVPRMISSRSKYGIEVTVERGLFIFFTSLGIPVVDAKCFADSNRGTTNSMACVSFNPDHSTGIIAIGMLEKIEKVHLWSLKSNFTQRVHNVFNKFGFHPTTTSKTNLCTWFWINFGKEENRNAAKLEFHIYEDECQAVFTFFSVINECVERNLTLKSMFLYPVITVVCTNAIATQKCLCELLLNVELPVLRTNNMNEIPADCPLVLRCSGDTSLKSCLNIYINGHLKHSSMVGSDDICSLEFEKKLHVYDSLIEPTLCHSIFYCTTCIEKKTCNRLRHEMMLFGVIEDRMDVKCCSDGCPESHQLYLVASRI